MCITPLSIDIAKSNLFPRQTTKAGPLRLDSCSGNKASGINSLILFFSCVFSFSIKKTGILLFSKSLLEILIILFRDHSFLL